MHGSGEEHQEETANSQPHHFSQLLLGSIDSSRASAVVRKLRYDNKEARGGIAFLRPPRRVLPKRLRGPGPPSLPGPNHISLAQWSPLLPSGTKHPNIPEMGHKAHLPIYIPSLLQRLWGSLMANTMLNPCRWKRLQLAGANTAGARLCLRSAVVLSSLNRRFRGCESA
ncbi:unnamed protein product [Pleuronectes platessa]|uniref:Uncharacterized protein n=1 Tax=Pleuronectes platessa TaxID=8262 RepID=A0A9N7TXX6_PLEPL|nr:unnamed protein product [Pleuronectes platessa]